MKNHAKILSFGVLFLIVCTWQLSAQDCSFSKNETDKFTDSRVLHTKPVNVISKNIKLKKVYTIEKIEMQIKYESNNYLLALTYHFAFGYSIANTKSNIILLLADGSKIETPCLQNIPSTKYKSNGVVIYTYNFGISETDLMKLIDSDITDIRMTAEINPVEFSINNTINTKELFKCIYNNK